MKRKSGSFALRGVWVWMCAACVLSGCWDRREINDIAFVLSSSVDTVGRDKYKFGVLVALPGQMGGQTGGGGGTSGKQPYYIDSDIGENIRVATFNLQKRMARELNFTHRRVIIFGEELARKGIRPVFDGAARVPQNRLTAYLVIAKGRGEEVLAASPHMERSSGEAIREILTLTAAGKTNLKEIALKLSQDGVDPVIPVFETIPNKGPDPELEVQAAGLALFSDDKMVGIVKNEEVNALLWAINRFSPPSGKGDGTGKSSQHSGRVGRGEIKPGESGPATA